MPLYRRLPKRGFKNIFKTKVQSINFKIRLGPQKRNKLSAIEHLSRGIKGCPPDSAPPCPVKSGCNEPGESLCHQNDQFEEYNGSIPLDGLSEEDKEWQEERIRRNEEQVEELEEFYDRYPKEDGTSHAGVMEHVRHVCFILFTLEPFS